MENLLMMLTVFLMRFIRQMLIFRATSRVEQRGNIFKEKTQFHKLICIMNLEASKRGESQGIQVQDDGSFDLSLGDIWSSIVGCPFYLGEDIKEGNIIYNRIRSRDGHYVVIINCTILILPLVLAQLC
jgi:hypothetical protein